MFDPHIYIYSEDGVEYHLTSDCTCVPDGVTAAPLADETVERIADYGEMLEQHGCSVEWD